MKMAKWLDMEKRVVTKDHRRKKGSVFFITSIWIGKDYKKKPSSVHSLSRVWLFAAPRTAAHEASLSITNSCPSHQWCHPTISCSIVPFSLPFPSPGNLPNPGIEPGSPTLQANTLPSEPPGQPPKNKVSHCFRCYSIYLSWSDVTGYHDRSYMNVEF